MQDGFLGHHAVSKHHWLLVLSSQSNSPRGAGLLGFQISTRLSLPQLKRRSGSYKCKQGYEEYILILIVNKPENTNP
jgi:hypothetical protein